MDIKDYAPKAVGLINPMWDDRADLAHMAMGISGEAGEVLDIIKKHFAYGKTLDRDHVIAELGDLCFYINGLLYLLDTTWEEVLDVNIAKLSARYPDLKFSSERAINRDLDAEQKAMSDVSR